MIEYVKNQQEHHKTISFRDEFIGLLKDHDIEFDEKISFVILIFVEPLQGPYSRRYLTDYSSLIPLGLNLHNEIHIFYLTDHPCQHQMIKLAVMNN